MRAQLSPVCSPCLCISVGGSGPNPLPVTRPREVPQRLRSALGACALPGPPVSEHTCGPVVGDRCRRVLLWLTVAVRRAASPQGAPSTLRTCCRQSGPCQREQRPAEPWKRPPAHLLNKGRSAPANIARLAYPARCNQRMDLRAVRPGGACLSVCSRPVSPGSLLEREKEHCAGSQEVFSKDTLCPYYAFGAVLGAGDKARNSTESLFCWNPQTINQSKGDRRHVSDWDTCHADN